MSNKSSISISDSFSTSSNQICFAVWIDDEYTLLLLMFLEVSVLFTCYPHGIWCICSINNCDNFVRLLHDCWCPAEGGFVAKFFYYRFCIKYMGNFYDYLQLIPLTVADLSIACFISFLGENFLFDLLKVDWFSIERFSMFKV